MGGALWKNWYVRRPKSGISEAGSKEGHAQPRTIVTEVEECLACSKKQEVLSSLAQGMFRSV